MEYFEQAIEVPGDKLEPVAIYIAEKKLAPTELDRGAPDFDADRFRYPDLTISEDESGVPHFTSRTSVRINQQDYFLSDPLVRSPLGAVTTAGKKGSKTGISHLLDWATLLELITSNGSATVHSELIAKMRDLDQANPYVLGNEKLVYSEIILRRDFDMFRALLIILKDVKGVFRKKDAVEFYVKAVQSIVDKAEHERLLSGRQRQTLFALWRDIKRSGQRESIVESTAWHRVASRLECYVDLGFLQKPASTRYQYSYEPTNLLEHVWDTLEPDSDADDWISDNLVDVLLDTSSSKRAMSASEILDPLSLVIRHLTRPTAPLPLDAVAAGLVWIMANRGEPLSLAAAWRSLLDLARDRPDVARISTGSTSAPEYISVRIGRS